MEFTIWLKKEYTILVLSLLNSYNIIVKQLVVNKISEVAVLTCFLSSLCTWTSLFIFVLGGCWRHLDAIPS